MELLGLILCIWLLCKVFKLLMKMTWGITKGVVSLAMGLASVMVMGCLFFAGGILILIPLALLAVLFGILKGLL